MIPGARIGWLSRVPAMYSGDRQNMALGSWDPRQADYLDFMSQQGEYWLFKVELE